MIEQERPIFTDIRNFYNAVCFEIVFRSLLMIRFREKGSESMCDITRFGTRIIRFSVNSYMCEVTDTILCYIMHSVKSYAFQL